MKKQKTKTRRDYSDLFEISYIQGDRGGIPVLKINHPPHKRKASLRTVASA